MWWILFTAIDLYLGLIAIDVLTRSESIPAEKLRRLAITKKVLLAGLSLCGVFFVVRLWK
ncbi:MAG TPA: hypothetical protein VJQ82_02515 [Terriglobales bacterium]|nr:hypothetical protein [Terriglobales bacterium]